jgi:ubiquinone/menaquinone biosynthesis C-methylase UbiE
MPNQQIQRVTTTKASTQAAYDRISRWYNLLEGIWEKGARDIGLTKLHVCEGERALEIGFGPGEDLVALASSASPEGRVFGIDLSSKMAHVAQVKLEKAGLGLFAGLVQGDAEFLPFKDGTFDAIFMSFALELFDTPVIPEVVAQCHRILRDEVGRICVVALTKVGPPSRMRQLYEWGHDHFPALLDCRPIYVRSALEAQGFEIMDATLVSVSGIPVEVVVGGKRD